VPVQMREAGKKRLVDRFLGKFQEGDQMMDG
jgi:hypothetical protein